MKYEQVFIDITYRDGSTKSIGYVPGANGTFRFILDYHNWLPIGDGETIEQAVRREWAGICRRCWPTMPQYWPVDAPD